MSKLNILAREIHLNAVDKGFWENELSDEHCLMLVITELSEAIEADRKKRIARMLDFESLIFVKYSFKDGKAYDMLFKGAFEKLIKDSTGDEMADAYIRLLYIAGAMGCDLKVKTHQVDGEMFEVHKNTFCENAFAIIGLFHCQTYASLDSKISYILGDIRTMSGFYGIDLDKHISYKMKYNSTRERMHGKLY